jgi:hypothetical protein
MYPTPSSDLRHRVVVLFSESSRRAAAAEADRRGQTYAFTGAAGRPVTWLKGEYAGLAVNAATEILNRCNLKHDLLEEAELLPAPAGSLHRTAVRGPGQRGLDGCRALIIPAGGHLLPATIEAIATWLVRGDGRLLVTGPTNLPDGLLGLSSRRAVTPEGYTGWRWRAESSFGDHAHWEDDYVTGYRGHTAWAVSAATGATALADLVEYATDPAGRPTGEPRPLGDAIVRTGRTVYVANQVLELLGGVMQAHLNVENVRKRQNPLHWGDTLALFVRQLLLELGLDDLWQTRLRTFGNHAGAFSYRQDVHGHQEFAALDYEAANLIPATFDLEDPAVSEHTTTEQARVWADRTDGYDFIERGLHNDSVAGNPPNAVRGQGLRDHVAAAEERLGYPIYTCGRHGGGHLHPETLDAMD